MAQNCSSARLACKCYGDMICTSYSFLVFFFAVVTPSAIVGSDRISFLVVVFSFVGLGS